MIHDHDPHRFGLALSTYLGADPEVTAITTCQELDRLIGVRDGGAPAEAIAQAEGLVAASLAFLGSIFGPEDVADALAREAVRHQQKAQRDASVMRAVEEGLAR